jgi:glycosyltransferase involved in cell wall biosynthesis
MITLVTTLESSGIDRYSKELAERIGMPTVESKRYLSLKGSLKLLYKLRQSPYLVHFPSQHFGRYGLFLRKPFIVTVHDLVRTCFPFANETIPQKLGLKLDVLGLRKAQHIIAVSECTKTDLIRYLNIPARKITVIYNGVNRNVFKPLACRRYDFPYLLYVGTERPRKNLGTLFAAFSSLKMNNIIPDLKLVKVGSAGRTSEFRQATLHEIRRLGLENEVVFVDYASDKDLVAYYSSALALVMPSLYEGFGLPLIEAMACGCPVIASNSSSLPEVAEHAALFFAPRDSLELARLVNRLVTEPIIRNELIGRGFDRVTRFSWERSAQETLQLYQRVEIGLGFRFPPTRQRRVGQSITQHNASPSKYQNVKNGSELVKR